ncbi:MAG: hypothetical protein ACRDZP_04170 [Acidimicrobiales bacterium]
MWVLVLLAIVWIVALTPMVLRKLREREVVTSVTTFNSQLSRLSGAHSRSERGGSVPGAAIGYSAAAQRLHEERYGVDFSEPASGSEASGVTLEPAPVVSRATTFRRRRVLASLGLCTSVSFLLGFVVSAFDYLAIVGLLAGITYLGLLAYFHRLAVERVQKVVALETRRGVAIALDHARHSGGVQVVQPKPRIGGNGWSVPESEFEDDETASELRELVSAGR